MFQVTQRNGRALQRRRRIPASRAHAPQPRGAHQRHRARRRTRRRPRRRRAPAQAAAAASRSSAPSARCCCAPARSARRSCLLLSGIGAGDELQTAGVEVRHDLPGVGRNLQDHPFVTVIWEVSDHARRCTAPTSRSHWLSGCCADRAAQLDRRRGGRVHAHARRAACRRHPIPHGRRLLRRPWRGDLRRPLHGDRAGAGVAAGPRPGVAALRRSDRQAEDHHQQLSEPEDVRVADRGHAPRARDRRRRPAEAR